MKKKIKKDGIEIEITPEGREYQIGDFKISLKGLPKVPDLKVPNDWFTKTQPMTTIGLDHGETYFAKKVLEDVWETCTYGDICDKDYEPFFAIPSPNGVAIYDINKKPIICTDRQIFAAKCQVSFERAMVTKDIWVLPTKDGKPPFKKDDGELFIAWSIKKKPE
jgi:hypothetical protein